MTRNYILEDNLKNAIGRIIKFSYWLSLIIFSSGLLFSGYLLVFKPYFYFANNYQLTYFVIVSSLPMFLFLFSFYIYENIYALKRTTTELKVKSIIWILYLSLPALFVIFRFNPFLSDIKVGSISVVTTILFLIFGGNWNDNITIKSLRLFGDIKYIMFDFWNKSKKKTEYEAKHFVQDLTSERKPLYIEKYALEIFQSSISCPKFDVEAAFSNDKLSTLNKNITVLDIGGAEGEFTKYLLEKYTSQTLKKIDKIQVVDPVDFIQNYRERMKGMIEVTKIFYSQEPYESWAPTASESYDLVIASHSLYAAIDNKNSSVENLIKKLKSNKAPNGKIIVVLASREGRAYTFKKKALSIILGVEKEDIDANVFKQELSDAYASQKTDNIIDLTSLLQEFEEGKQENLVLWLSYFLRIDKKNLTGHNLNRIVKLLRFFSQPLYELNEEKIITYIATAYPKPLDRNTSIVLSHKTEIIIF